MQKIISTNFEFLQPDNENLASPYALESPFLFIEPSSTLARLRSFAEECTTIDDEYLLALCTSTDELRISGWMLDFA